MPFTSMPIFAYISPSTAGFDHPLLMLGALAWCIFAVIAFTYVTMLGAAGGSPSFLRRVSRLRAVLALSVFVALGVFFTLAITGLQTKPGA